MNLAVKNSISFSSTIHSTLGNGVVAISLLVSSILNALVTVSNSLSIISNGLVIVSNAISIGGNAIPKSGMTLRERKFIKKKTNKGISSLELYLSTNWRTIQ